MERDTFVVSLRAFTRRVPFRPFLVELVSGSRFSVEHPEALAFRGGNAVYLTPRGDWATFDHLSVAQLLDTDSSAQVPS